tara:strand:- start:6023 stop:7909 length:1887 start_codon:yes stop_codon:yes gene_type:complete
MAYTKITNKTQTKEIKYLNKDFDSFRGQLIDFTKTYYPNTYNDFSEGSPGMMFMEMAAYVGDVLSYYVDTQLQETFLDTAQERTNLFHLAYTLGYKPQVTAVSSTNLDIFHLIPSKGVSGDKTPDFDYALTIDQPSAFKSETGTSFVLQKPVIFSYSSSVDPTELSIYSIDGNNDPEYYLLKKSTPVISSEIVTKTFELGESQRYLILNLIDDNIVSIESIKDTEGNIWTEVPYLAQNTVFTDMPNTRTNTPNLSSFNNATPYLLKLKKVPKRFVTRFIDNGSLEIQFGGGSSDKVDEVILPNPDNVGLGNRDGRSKLDQAIDPSNFLLSKTYGEIPKNTTLTITYLRGGGIKSNLPSNTINKVEYINTTNKPNLNGNILSFTKESLAVTNPEPSTGGGEGDSIEDIRLNTIASFSSQQRAITKEDYIVRTLSMPSKYGSISKAYIVKSSNIEHSQTNIESSDLSSNLYILGYDRDKYLTTLNSSTKTNLITYLNEFKTLTDSINIKDAFIINYGIDFEITTFSNTNDQEILLNCISALKDYFNIDKWQINQPIIRSEIYNTIANIKGVQSVTNIKINNITGIETGYSQYKYDFESATKNDTIYPSLDPSIFEIKYPNSDIKGKIIQY